MSTTPNLRSILIHVPTFLVGLVVVVLPAWLLGASFERTIVLIALITLPFPFIQYLYSGIFTREQRKPLLWIWGGLFFITVLRIILESFTSNFKVIEWILAWIIAPLPWITVIITLIIIPKTRSTTLNFLNRRIDTLSDINWSKSINWSKRFRRAFICHKLEMRHGSVVAIRAHRVRAKLAKQVDQVSAAQESAKNRCKLTV